MLCYQLVNELQELSIPELYKFSLLMMRVTTNHFHKQMRDYVFDAARATFNYMMDIYVHNNFKTIKDLILDDDWTLKEL